MRKPCAVSLLVSLLACGDVPDPFTPAEDPQASELFWELTLNHAAATISTVAPYDTVRLVATPRDADGNPLTGLGPVTFTSLDPFRVEVSPDGLARGLAPGADVTVHATLTIGHTTHQKNVRINVTEASQPPVLAQVSVEPPDSAVWSLSGDGSTLSIDGRGTVSNVKTKFYFGQITDASGNPVPDVNIALESSDRRTAFVGGGGTLVMVDPKRPGPLRVVGTATAYGTSVTDTVEFSLIMPTFGVVRVAAPSGSTGIGFISPDITISPGGTVIWANVSGQPVDIVFDDPTNVAQYSIVSCEKAGVIDPGGAGNVEPFGVPQDPDLPLDAGNCRSRSFPIPGVYPYRSTLTGATGRIVVNDGLSGS
jgi:hypothetical protein